MEKKVVIAILVVILVIAVSLYFIFRPKYYAEDPRGWIEAKANNTKEINITKATRGAGLLNPAGLQYSDGKVLTAFDYDGFYEGNYFPSRGFYDLLTGQLLMGITPEMQPGNGVIEGFIIEYIRGSDVVAYIFVDEDWKQKLGANTNIIWGKDLQIIKKFEFGEASDGVYVDTIIDDSERFQNKYTERDGGIIVGDANLNNIMFDDFSGKTVLRLV